MSDPKPRNHLDTLITNAGYNHSSLALAMGIARDTVIKWVRGDRRPEPNMMTRLVEYLGVEAAEVLAALDTPYDPYS